MCMRTNHFILTGDTCPGHNVFYDPDVLVIEDIQSAPLLPSNAEPTSHGYLYLFPNLTFTEAGSFSGSLEQESMMPGLHNTQNSKFGEAEMEKTSLSYSLPTTTRTHQEC